MNISRGFLVGHVWYDLSERERIEVRRTYREDRASLSRQEDRILHERAIAMTFRVLPDSGNSGYPGGQV